MSTAELTLAALTEAIRANISWLQYFITYILHPDILVLKYSSNRTREKFEELIRC